MEVGASPAAWNAGVFSPLIKRLSETVILLPIAGLI